jgi:hypothetical protein
VLPLAAVPRESFDPAAFRRETGRWLRWRFRALYYLLEVIYVAAYARACIRHSAGRRAR